MDDFIVNYLLHFQISRHTTIPAVHELAWDVLKACSRYIIILTCANIEIAFFPFTHIY